MISIIIYSIIRKISLGASKTVLIPKHHANFEAEIFGGKR